MSESSREEPEHLGDVRRLLEHGLREFGLGHVQSALALWEAVLGIEPLNVRATKYIAHARGAERGEGAMTDARDDGADDTGEAVEEMVVDEASIGSAIAPLRRKMHELFALGNYTDALVVAHNILEAVPDDVEAVGTRQRAADALEKIFLSKIAALDEPLEIRMTPEEAVWLNLSPLEAEVFAQIDGTTPLNDFLPAAGADRLDALRFLARMSEDGAIGVPGRQNMIKHY